MTNETTSWNEPRKLELLKASNLLSTELVGIHDEDQTSFSYAYKFETNQGSFIAIKWDVFTSDDIQAELGSKDYKKAWEQRVKDELLATRKDIIQGTLKFFRKQLEGGVDPKEALKDLLLEDYDSESALNNMKQDFRKDKKAEKVWKSVKM